MISSTVPASPTCEGANSPGPPRPDHHRPDVDTCITDVRLGAAAGRLVTKSVGSAQRFLGSEAEAAREGSGAGGGHDHLGLGHMTAGGIVHQLEANPATVPVDEPDALAHMTDHGSNGKPHIKPNTRPPLNQ